MSPSDPWTSPPNAFSVFVSFCAMLSIAIWRICFHFACFLQIDLGSKGAASFAFSSLGGLRTLVSVCILKVEGLENAPQVPFEARFHRCDWGGIDFGCWRCSFRGCIHEKRFLARFQRGPRVVRHVLFRTGYGSRPTGSSCGSNKSTPSNNLMKDRDFFRVALLPRWEHHFRRSGVDLEGPVAAILSQNFVERWKKHYEK